MTRRLALSATLVMLALLAAPTATATPGDDGPREVVLTLNAEDEPAFRDAPAGFAERRAYEPGVRAAWSLNLTDAYTVLEVRVHGAFDVARPKQVVPLLDDRHFTPVSAFDVAEADAPERILNVDGSADAFTYRLGLPGPGVRNLTLVLDRAPPAFTFTEIGRETHYGFFVNTSTDEAARATLHVRPAAGGEEVAHPTPGAGGWQRFPVQGLEPDTEYAFRVVFEDWSGNTAESAVKTIRTAPAPDVPRPVLTVIQPLGASYAPADVPAVQVRIETPSPVLEDGVRFFFDKTELREGWTITDDGVLAYDPPRPLATGYHSFSVEVRNAAGGEAHVVGSFTVEDHATPGAGFIATAAGVAVALALTAGRRPRRGPAA